MKFMDWQALLTTTVWLVRQPQRGDLNKEITHRNFSAGEFPCAKPGVFFWKTSPTALTPRKIGFRMFIIPRARCQSRGGRTLYC
jgi:hypothetical protein